MVDDVVVSGGERVELEVDSITNGTSDCLVTAERSENTKLTTNTNSFLYETSKLEQQMR